MLSLSDLQEVIRCLCLPRSRAKVAVMQVLLDDFLQEHLQFFHLCSMKPLTILVSEHHFNPPYGTISGNVLRDLCVISHFNQQYIHVPYPILYGETWLMLCYDDMFSRLSVSRLLKETLLEHFHLIPAHIRPSYNSRSVCSCRRALANFWKLFCPFSF